MNRVELERNVFAELFRVGNTLQVYLDRHFKCEELTAKQLFLMIAIHHFGVAAPNLHEAAKYSGSSYQNVKQLAVKLQRSGYVKIQEDERDSRVKRLVLTDQAVAYWEKRSQADIATMDMLFQIFETKELQVFFDSLTRLRNELEKKPRQKNLP